MISPVVALPEQTYSSTIDIDTTNSNNGCKEESMDEHEVMGPDPDAAGAAPTDGDYEYAPADLQRRGPASSMNGGVHRVQAEHEYASPNGSGYAAPVQVYADGGDGLADPSSDPVSANPVARQESLGEYEVMVPDPIPAQQSPRVQTSSTASQSSRAGGVERCTRCKAKVQFCICDTKRADTFGDAKAARAQAKKDTADAKRAKKEAEKAAKAEAKRAKDEAKKAKIAEKKAAKKKK